MKLAWILFLIVLMNVVKRNTAQNDNSESKNALTDRMIEITNKTNTETEQHDKEKGINYRKKFFVTRKPPININHVKHRRIKKKPLNTKIQNKRKISAPITKPTKISLKYHNFRKPRIATKKYINQYMKSFFQKTISNTDISVEDNSEELKEKKAIVCTGPEIKSIVAQAGSIAINERWFRNNYKLKDLLKIRKCFLKFKRLENAVRIKDIKLSEAIQKKLNTFESNNANSTAKNVSSEKKFNFMNEFKRKFDESSTHDKIATTESVIRDTRSKRSVIEEEGVATTSSGYKFTGRDLLIHSGYMYRNIHN